MTSRILYNLLAMLPALVFVSTAAAQEDVRRVKLRQEGLKVIEEKCLVCHNRQRIDTAIQERKDMERIIRLMEKKGVAVSERERQVIGHFWQQKVFKPQGSEVKP